MPDRVLKDQHRIQPGGGRSNELSREQTLGVKTCQKNTPPTPVVCMCV